MVQSLDDPGPTPARAGLRAAVIRWRLQRTHAQAQHRRDRLAHWLDGVDHATFARNGFVLKRQVLPPAAFEALREQLQALADRAGAAGPCRWPLDAAACRAAPALAGLLHGRLWNGLTRYVAASGRPARAGLRRMVAPDRSGARDPQTFLHSDAAAPTMKAWYFLHDVADDDAPLCYVPGSHRLTGARLTWELRQRLGAAGEPPRHIDKFELGALGLGHPARLVVPANTLVVADTFGFHKRAQARHPATRLELWAASPGDHGDY